MNRINLGEPTKEELEAIANFQACADVLGAQFDKDQAERDAQNARFEARSAERINEAMEAAGLPLRTTGSKITLALNSGNRIEIGEFSYGGDLRGSLKCERCDFLLDSFNASPKNTSGAFLSGLARLTYSARRCDCAKKALRNAATDWDLVARHIQELSLAAMKLTTTPAISAGETKRLELAITALSAVVHAQATMIEIENQQNG